MERRMISAHFVADALECLGSRTIAAAPLLAAAGLPETVTAPVSAEQYGALWRAIAAALDDEYFGLGDRPMRRGSFGLLCHCVLHSGTLETALHRILRFLRVVLDNPFGILEVAGGEARVVLADAGPARSAFAYRTFWILVHGVACWLVGRRIPLKRVDFRCEPPAHGADYRLFFGAPVRFGQATSCLVFDATYLALPTIRTERALTDFLRQAPANILVRYRHDAGLSASIRKALRAMPPAAWPDMAALSRQLRIPAPTLRRRLRAEGQTYRSIRDELRRGIAITWLLQSPRNVGEIAADLGFAEPSAFHRAFRAWTGKSPGAFRREGHPGAAENAGEG